MILDVHTHLLFEGSINKKTEELLRSMDEAGIDRALVFAGVRDPQANRLMLDAIADYRSRLSGVGALSPIEKPPPLSEIEDGLSSGLLSGLKVYTGYEHVYPDDERLRPYLELLEKLGKPVIFHSGDTYSESPGARLKYAHPLAVDDLAADMPDLKIVIAHLGFPWITDAAAVCLKNRNVYADLSGFVYGAFQADDREAFATVLQRFSAIVGGNHKFLFGTDWPISDQKSYVDVLRDVAPELLQDVFEANAGKIFGY
jgi:hypothetical protein